MSGDLQVQKQKDNAVFGFYANNDVQFQFKSSQDYLAYKKGLLGNRQKLQIIAPGNVGATMSLSGTRNITDTFIGPGQYDDAYVRLPIAFEFNFGGVNYGSRLASGGLFWTTNNLLCFGDNFIVTYDPSGGDPGIYLGTADRVINSVYVVDTVRQGNFYIFKLIVNYYNYSDPDPTIGEAQTGSFELRIVKEATAYKRQWIEVRTQKANNYDGFDQLAFWNIVFESESTAPEQNGPQYTFGAVPYLPTDRSSFVLASDAQGLSWRLFDQCHLTL